MKFGIVLLLVTLLSVGCERLCNKESYFGEVVQIPLDLKNHPGRQAQNLSVWSVNSGDTTESSLSNILYYRQVTENNSITDNPPSGYYSSDLDGSSLYFFEYVSQDSIIIRDSMTNIIIKKSQKTESDPCYADDPNIQIDELSFTHDGVVKGKGDVVVLAR